METVVARILSEEIVVLGAGADKNVKEGMRFEIWEPGEEILDPVTKESLGSLEIVKGRVDVIRVMAKMCMAKSIKNTVTKTRMVSPLSTLFSPLSSHAESYEVDVMEKMKVDRTDSDYEQRLVVRVGDRARVVVA